MVVLGIVVAIIIIILFLPIIIKAKANYELIENLGYITGKFFFIRVFLIKFRIYGNYIYIYSKKEYAHKYKIISQGPPTIFADIIIFEILKIIKFKTLKIYAGIGVKDSPYLTSMLCSSMVVLGNSFISYFKTKKPKAIIKSGIYPMFCKDSLIFAGASSIRLNLFKLIICFIKSIFIYFEEGVKNGQRASNR